MSTGEQLDGDSLRRQLALSEDYALRNGLELAPENQLRDIGKSAFSGSHIRQGAFGAFLSKVKNGEIAPGSYLLVESLDRLSRQRILEAIQLFLDIIQSGVVLVTLLDGRKYTKDNLDHSSLLNSISSFTRANDESETKSRRGRHLWEYKRLLLTDPVGAEALAARYGLKRRLGGAKPYTAKCPAWLQPRSNGRGFDLIDNHAHTVRRIFNMAASGQGAFTITRSLNSTNTPCIGRSAKWHRSYVTKILTNRAAYGEFQPYRMEEGRRVPDGLCIPNYFPPAVPKEVFVSAQAGRKQRAVGGKGRKGAKVSNLFSGLARCAYCQSSIYYLDKGDSPKGGRYLQCAGALDGRGCKATTWRYNDFEASFFSFVREIDVKRLMSVASSQNRRAQLLDDLQSKQELRVGLVEEQGRAWSMNERRPIAYLEARLEQLQGQIDIIDEAILALRARINDDEDAGPSTDPSEIRQALFQATGETAVDLREKRFRIAGELRRLIVRLELGPSGRMHELIARLDDWDTTTDGKKPNVRRKIMATLGALPDQTSPFFRVTLRDGTQREVVIDNNDPCKPITHWELDREMWRLFAGDQPAVSP